MKDFIAELVKRTLDKTPGQTLEEKGAHLIVCHDELKHDKPNEVFAITMSLHVGMVAYHMNATDEDIYDFMNMAVESESKGGLGFYEREDAMAFFCMICEVMGATHLLDMARGGFEREKKNRAVKKKLEKAVASRKRTKKAVAAKLKKRSM